MSKSPFLTALPVLFAATLTPIFAPAQSLSGLTASGTVEIEYLNQDNSDATVLFGDVNLSFGPDVGQTGLGFDLGLYAIDTDNLSSETAIFAAVTYRTSYGKFSFGIPHAAANGFSRMPVVGGVQLISVLQDVYTDGTVENVYLLSDDTPIGLRYDGEYGALNTALTYHHFSDFDVNVFNAAASYDTGRFFAAGSYEIVEGAASSNQSSLHVEIGAAADLYEAGIGYTAGSNLVEDAFMGWATYRPIENLDVTASVLDIDGVDSLFGLSGTYTVRGGAYVQAGVVDSSGSDAIWDISLGYGF